MNNKIKKVAQESAQSAGEELLKHFYKFNRNSVKFKAHHEIITKADLAAEKIILDIIHKNFPDHQILSEEDGHNGKKSDYLWIIDPLDGTTNFSMHNPLFSVSIGVAYKGEIIMGVVHAPFLQETYTAQLGKGVKLNNKKIKVSNIRNLNESLNTYCHARENKYVRKALTYMRKQKLNGFDCRQLGSAAIELAFVAAGRVESIVIPGANSWDVAAGVLLVREAGGRVSDFSNKKWNLNSNNMLASNGLVHKDIISILNNK